MTNEAISYRTKKQLGEALKSEMRKKEFSKITVSSLINICDINRNTFYYHFDDIYDLLHWVLDQEGIELLKKMDFLVNAEEAVNFILDYIDENKKILNCAFDSVSHAQLMEFFNVEMRAVVLGTIEEAEGEMHVRLDRNYREFITLFFTEALSGALISYLSGKNPWTREQIVDYLITTCSVSLKAMLKEKGRPV